MVAPVFNRYRELLREHAPSTGLTLKTDCFNEAIGGFRDLGDVLDPERTFYLEIDYETVQRAKQNCPDRSIWLGDIRQLPWNDATFVVIFDLSTIDHIPPEDVPAALSEYRRTLVHGGKLIMVVWCSEERRDEPIDWPDGLQYFFWEGDVLEAMRGFHIKHRDVIHRGEGIYLVEFIAEKV